ncbi:hypothetical protein QQF64_023591, partial [Cirrhinus molitorella]
QCRDCALLRQECGSFKQAFNFKPPFLKRALAVFPTVQRLERWWFSGRILASHAGDRVRFRPMQ